MVDLKNLKDVKPGVVLTHLHCPNPEKEGFKDRLKLALKMPIDQDHPLIF